MFGSLAMANYGPEIVVGTGENSVGNLAEKSLVFQPQQEISSFLK